MKIRSLLGAWAVGVILCAGLGFIPGFSETIPPALEWALGVLGLAAFLPPALLIRLAGKAGDRKTLTLVRNLCAASLGLTAVVLVASILSTGAPAWLGNFLHILLILVSSPMFCFKSWAVSLFLWACLLMASLSRLKKG